MKKYLTLAVMCILLLAGCGHNTKSGRAESDSSIQTTRDGEDTKGPSRQAGEANIPDNGLPTIYDFSATWCGPCRGFAPIFEKVGEKYAGKVNFISIDVDDNEELARKYGVSSIPTVIFFDGKGKMVNSVTGAMDYSTFENLVKSEFNL